MLLTLEVTIRTMAASWFCSIPTIVHTSTVKAHRSLVPFPFVVSLLRVIRAPLDYKLASTVSALKISL